MKKERIIVPVGRIEQNKGQLAPWLPKNPRLWTKSDLERMKASIVEDPDLLQDEDAIAVVAHPSKKGHYIVFDGNLRSTAAQELYDKGHELNAWLYTPEGEEDQETIRRRTIKANGFYGSNDWEALANEWPEDKLEAWGVPAWDTDQGEGEGEPIAATEDDFDEAQDEIHVRCAKGDIWQLGDHRLMCGDSTDADTVKKLMDGSLADMVFTDPPYGTTQLAWDKEPDLSKMFTCLISYSKDNAALLIFGTQPFVTDLINAKRDLFKYEIVWEKSQATGFFNAKKAP